jgi:hypothetical protein
MSRAILISEGVFGFRAGPASSTTDILIIIGAFVMVALLVFLWAVFVRKPRHRRHSYHHNRTPGAGPAVGLPPRRARRPALFRLLRGHHHRRLQHPRERPLNPTLAQVGGLPAPRREHPPVP